MIAKESKIKSPGSAATPAVPCSLMSEVDVVDPSSPYFSHRQNVTSAAPALLGVPCHDSPEVMLRAPEVNVSVSPLVPADTKVFPSVVSSTRAVAAPIEASAVAGIVPVKNRNRPLLSCALAEPVSKIAPRKPEEVSKSFAMITPQSVECMKRR